MNSNPEENDDVREATYLVVREGAPSQEWFRVDELS